MLERIIGQMSEKVLRKLEQQNKRQANANLASQSSVHTSGATKERKIPT
jgi:hypothetical protein